MFTSIRICNFRGQHYVVERTHDATGTDYRHLFAITQDQARGLAAGGEHFPHTPPDATEAQPIRLNIREIDADGCGTLYAGNDRLGTVGPEIVELIPMRMTAA